MENLFTLDGRIKRQTQNNFTIIKIIIIIFKFVSNLKFTKYNNKSSYICLTTKEILFIFFSLKCCNTFHSLSLSLFSSPRSAPFSLCGSSFGIRIPNTTWVRTLLKLWATLSLIKLSRGLDFVHVVHPTQNVLYFLSVSHEQVLWYISWMVWICMVLDCKSDT